MRRWRFSSLEYEQHLNLGEPMNITAKSSARSGRTAAAVLAIPLLLGAGLATATAATALEGCPPGDPTACVRTDPGQTPAPGGPLVTVPPAIPTEPAPAVPTGSATIQPIPQPSVIQPVPVQPVPVQPAPPEQTLTPIPEIRYTPPGNPGVSTMDPNTGHYTEAVPSPVGVPEETATPTDAEPSPEPSTASPTPKASSTASPKATSTTRSTAAPAAGSTGSATDGGTATASPTSSPQAADVERTSSPLAVPAMALGSVAALALAAVLIYRRKPKGGVSGS